MTAADCFASRYTGLFTAFGRLAPRPHDPELAMWAGSLAPSGARHEVLHVGGAGLSDEEARLACLGEAIERQHSAPLARDRAIEASYSDWPLREPAVDPRRWVLFSAEQYRLPGFPFRPFDAETRCRWQAFREVKTGAPCWVPEDLAYLHPRRGGSHAIAAQTSTGLSAGTRPDWVRGLQEVIERDALLGAWWGRYALEEHEASRVFATLGPELEHRLLRPNLEYRCYRIASPFSDHVTIVTLAGEEREGFVWNAGSACRETRGTSWRKAMIEAVQGRHHARWALGQGTDAPPDRMPESFVEHALYYTRHPERLRATVLAAAKSGGSGEPSSAATEGVSELAARLGPEHPILFRIATPPIARGSAAGFLVLKVLVVGLQPLHGDHRLAHLGGPSWAPRSLAQFQAFPPHPFA